MKKLIKNLFKNNFFKKITLSLIFIAMCSLACFMNWQSVVGAADSMAYKQGLGEDEGISYLSFNEGHSKRELGSDSLQYQDISSPTITNLTSPGVMGVVGDRSETAKITFHYRDSDVALEDLVTISYRVHSLSEGDYSEIPGNSFTDGTNLAVGDYDLKVEAKDGYDVSGLYYSLNGSDPEQWGDSDNKIFSITQDSSFVFSNIKTSFKIEEVDGSSQESIYEKLNIKYARSIWIWQEFPSNGLTYPVGSTIRVRVEPKSGYDISDLQYSLDNSTYSNWGTTNAFNLNKPTVLYLKNIKYKQIKLHFVGLDEEENNILLDENLVKILYSGDEYTIGNNNVMNIKGVAEIDFDIIKGAYCNNTQLTLDNFEKDPNNSEISFSNGYHIGNTNDNNANEDTSILFNLHVSIKSSSDNIYIKIKGLEYRKAKFRFTRDEQATLYDEFRVMGSNGTEYNNWCYENSSSSYVEVEDVCDLGQSFVFYLKTGDYTHWIASKECGWGELISLDTSNGNIGNIAVEYDEGKAAYKITFEDIACDLVNVNLNSNAVAVSNINIKFSSINLPNDIENHNGITVKQGNIEASYFNSANDPYVFCATIIPKNPQNTLNITLSDIKTFKFEPVYDANSSRIDFTFYDVNNTCLGNTSFTDISNGEGHKIAFNIPNNVVDYLHAGDITVHCNCLRANPKRVKLELNNGVKAELINSQTLDQQGIIEVPYATAEYDVKYGTLLNIKGTINSGYFMDIPEDCIHIYKLNDDGSEGSSITNWEISKDTVDGSTYEVNIFEPLLSDIMIVFTCDQNNIPITFKNIEGASYYVLDMDYINDNMAYINTNMENTNTDNLPSFSNKLFEKENDKNKILSGIVTVQSEMDYYFAVGAHTGYDISQLNITQNGILINDSDTLLCNIYVDTDDSDVKETYKIYRLKNIESNITVNGTISKKILTTEFLTQTKVEGGGIENGETATITYKRDNYDTTKEDVTYGNTVTFTVGLEDKYNHSNFEVFACDVGDRSPEEIMQLRDSLKNNTLDELINDTSVKPKKVTKYQNEYRITDIMENKIVFVKGVKINQYVLNFVPSSKAEFLSIEGAPLIGTQSVYFDGSFEFKVRAKTGYKLDDNLVVNCQKDSKDTALTATSNENGVYIFELSDIKENHTLLVDNVENIKYTITLANVAGATYLNDQNSVISGDIKINYGKNFEFSVSVDDAYDDSIAGMYIIINDGKSKLSAQKLASGRYMIPNITEDITIKVGNIRKNTYTVTLRNEDGIDYYNSSDKLITGDNLVDHKGSLSFRVYVYPSYSDSSITVMLGNDKMTPDSSGYYTVAGVIENKTVTVIGLHTNSEVELVNTINNLPSSINDLNDVNGVIEASKWYNSLSDDRKANITNIDVLKQKQEQAAAVLHKSNDVTIDGADWYIKLVVKPISSDMDACSRIYKKLNSEYILSLYDIYLLDTLNDVRYIPSSDKMYTITVPAPRLINFENPTGVHEDSNSGKISFMDLDFSGDTVSFETNSFSAMGIVANLNASGASSLFDAAGVNLDWINDYVVGDAKSGSSNKNLSGGTIAKDVSGADDYNTNDEITGNINDKFKSANNRVTPQGSALRLILVLLILVLLSLAIWVIYKKQKESKEKNR